MKVTCKQIKEQRHVCIVRKGGKVALPLCVSSFKLGQRVYFHLREDGVAFAATPKRAFRGRLLSSRIRRAVRTLAMYGPRAPASKARC
jgi:hypothetical protein